MALKAVHNVVSDQRLNTNNDPEPLHHSDLLLSPTHKVTSDDEEKTKEKKIVVIGHRGSGMNIPGRTNAIKENSILSFNSAAKFPIQFIEFDVQVTKDGCPVIFHDDFILTQHKGVVIEKRISEINLEEFLSYGPQKEPGKMVEKPLLRRTKDGRVFEWKVENDDTLCTLKEVFQKVEHSLGFNIELKFDDLIVYTQEQITHVLQAVLKVVNEYAKDRPIIFSSFQPDAALVVRKLQNSYPVFFLTKGGTEIYTDLRRNSLEEAIKLCLEGGLQGIVSEVKAILKNPMAITKIKDSKLELITYGNLNNVPEVVYIQHLMGVNGVIVDHVGEITEAVSEFVNSGYKGEEKISSTMSELLQKELSLLLLDLNIPKE